MSEIIKLSTVKGLRRVQRHKPPLLDSILKNIDGYYKQTCQARLTIMPGDETPEDRNWRGMLVGGLALVVDEREKLHVFTGYNTKRTSAPECATRKCAETRILEQIASSEIHNPFVSMLMVVGDFQLDDESGQRCDTLHPCGSCRRKLLLSEFMRKKTVIITARPPNEDGVPEFIEMHTQSTLVRHHSEAKKKKHR